MAGSSGGIGLGGASIDLATKRVSGVTLPPHPQPGDSWAQSFSVAGSLTIPGFGSAARASGDVDYDYRVVRIQTVKVPAGTFDALAIAADLRFDLTVEVSGVQAPVPLSFRTTEWYARGVGQVKSQGGGGIAGESVRETAVLTSYDA